MLSELHKLSKLIWQKKKCCDYKSWNFFVAEAYGSRTICVDEAYGSRHVGSNVSK